MYVSKVLLGHRVVVFRKVKFLAYHTFRGPIIALCYVTIFYDISGHFKLRVTETIITIQL